MVKGTTIINLGQNYSKSLKMFLQEKRLYSLRQNDLILHDS